MGESLKWIVEVLGSSSCTWFIGARMKEKVVGTECSVTLSIPFANKPLFLIRQYVGDVIFVIVNSSWYIHTQLLWFSTSLTAHTGS